ncbi:ABC transporter substrate-binding protein [Ferruginibacter yonginensis]|uniref:ABC transporter substrate-binding protein n=1 Tax=Ferruginibacter yonginensis TaxID=1310416 RepID=A0ABV8QT87_9BACT
MLRIGMLTPRSTLYPTISFDMLNGLKAGFEQLNFNDFTLFTENIGFGTDESEIYTKAEKMILGDNADVVIACCDSRIAAMLQPLFAAAGKLLLVTNMGANLPEDWQPHPTTITHSLNFCFNTSLTGALAATAGTGALAASYYDAGYNQVYTTLTRFQQKGGSILYNHVTHLKNEHFTLAPLQAFMASEQGTPNLLCLFCADMAELFYKAVAAIQLSQEANLFVSPMMLEESLASNLKHQVLLKNVQGYTPWLSTFTNTNNQAFVATYEAVYGKRPNVFAVLGWDTALLLDRFNKELAIHKNTAAAIKAMGEAPPLPSPRGWIKLDPLTNHIYGPANLVKASNYFDLTIDENSNLEIDDEWQRFKEEVMLPSPETSSAWRNTYLCI